MAKLRQDQKDGHYYTRRSRPGLGIQTDQIGLEGLALLQGHSIGVGDEIPKPLRKRLEHLGYLTTGGGGILPNNVSRWRSGAIATDTSPDYRSMDPLVTLCCSRDDRSCRLTLAFPAFDLSYLNGFSHSDRDWLQEKSNFRVLPGGRVPAVRLWPGQLPFHLNVSLESEYLIQAEHWPLGHTSPFMVGNSVPGCNPTGTFFAGSDGGGVRLVPRQPVSRGRNYFVLLPLSAGTPPSCLEPESLRLPDSGVTISSWRAWSITVPEDLEEHHSAAIWLASFQHPLSKSHWQLKLVWPPFRASEHGTSPQIVNGETILMTATPPTIAHTCETIGYSDKDFEIYIQDDAGVKEVTPLPYLSQGSAIPLRMKFPREGDYVIRDYDGLLTPLRVTVVSKIPHVEDQLLGPMPLRLVLVTIGPKEYRQEWTAFCQSADAPIQESLLREARLQFQVTSPVLVRAAWQSGGAWNYTPYQSATELTNTLNRTFPFGRMLQCLTAFLLESSGFGTLEIAVPLVKASDRREPRWAADDPLRQRARFVGAALSAQSFSGSARVPIPVCVRRGLLSARQEPDLCFLSALTDAPPSLLGHLAWIADHLPNTK